MDPTPEIKTFVVYVSWIFLGIWAIVIFLIIRLLFHRVMLKKARLELEDYSQNLQVKVTERTIELKLSEEKYRSLFEKSKEAIFIVEIESLKIIDFNPQALELTGFNEGEISELKFSDLYTGKFSYGQTEFIDEQIFMRRDGGLKIVDCVTGRIEYDGEKCWQIVCRDVTEKREMEARLIQSQKMTDLGHLAAGIAHELNTPLGTVYNSNYFIKGELKDVSPKVARHFHLIENQVDRCQKLIKNLLTFSRAPNAVVDLIKTDINDVLERCLQLIEKEIKTANIQIVKELSELPLILIDPDRISQVFFNLILNAVHAMPSGGSITIKSWNKYEKIGVRKSKKDKNLVFISFEDTGTGIPKDILSNIFTPFFSTKKTNQNIGLGLSISYEIVKSFNGDITVESEANKGTKFTIILHVEGKK